MTSRLRWRLKRTASLAALFLSLRWTRAVQLIAKCGRKRRPPNHDKGSIIRLMTLVARGRHVRKGPVESSLVLCFYGVVHRTFYLIRIRQLGRGQGFGIEARRFLESRTELLQLKCCQRAN